MAVSFSKKVDWKAEPNKREKIIFGIVVFLAIIAFFKSCWGPSRSAISIAKTELKETVKQKSQLEASLQKAQKGLSVKMKRNLNLTQKHEDIASAIVDSPEIFLMETLTEASLLKDIKMSDVKFPDATMDSGVMTQQFTVVLNGSFISINSYLERLYELPLLLVVDSLEVSLDNKESGRVKATLKGEVYGWK